MSACSNSVAGEASSCTSVVSVETATGWHVLKIEGYSLLKGRGLGKARSSSKFSVGGHIWCIAYYLDGHDTNSADWISIGLHLPSATDKDVRAQFKFSLLDKDCEPVSPHAPCASRVGSFSSTTSAWVFRKFIETKQLMESPYLIDDSFSVRCDVTVIKTETCQLFLLPPPDLHHHLGNLLTTGVGGDVTFDVNGEMIVAHKNVLAVRSPVFMAEFFGCPMKEKLVTENVRIKGIDASVFKTLLHFIYTDTLPDMDGSDKMVMAQHLLVAADMYNMERLKRICENTLRTLMNTSVVATTLVLAEQHGCDELKEACVKFLESPRNLKEVMAREDFNHLESSCPSLVKELRAKVIL
ncbi:hypothetical protein QOZ80_9AG0689770 [Eleusine coracana subsp. coracana]|nr:hypothetical protein QOZ80_9AG0689770 [Eleusine coracana subsp. coracana]